MAQDVGFSPLLGLGLGSSAAGDPGVRNTGIIHTAAVPSPTSILRCFSFHASELHILARQVTPTQTHRWAAPPPRVPRDQILVKETEVRVLAATLGRSPNGGGKGPSSGSLPAAASAAITGQKNAGHNLGTALVIRRGLDPRPPASPLLYEETHQLL